MSTRNRVFMLGLWFASLLIVGSLVSLQARQRIAPLQLVTPQPLQKQEAPVISGPDLGFRPEGWHGKARTGTWVVRINGEWVEAQSAMRTVPATTR